MLNVNTQKFILPFRKRADISYTSELDLVSHWQSINPIFFVWYSFMSGVSTFLDT